MNKLDTRDNIYNIKDLIIEKHKFPKMTDIMNIESDISNSTFDRYNKMVSEYNELNKPNEDILDGKGEYILLEYLPESNESRYTDLWFYHFVYQYNSKVLHYNDLIDEYTEKVKESVDKLNSYIETINNIPVKTRKTIELIFHKIKSFKCLTKFDVRIFNEKINDILDDHFIDNCFIVSLDKSIRVKGNFRHITEEIDSLWIEITEYRNCYKEIMSCFYKDVDSSIFSKPTDEKLELYDENQIKMNLQKEIFINLKPMGCEFMAEPYLVRMLEYSISTLRYVRIISKNRNHTLSPIVLLNLFNYTYNKALINYKDMYIVPQDLISEVKIWQIEYLITMARCGEKGYDYIKEFVLFDKRYDKVFGLENCFSIMPSSIEEDGLVKFKTYFEQIEDIMN